MSFRRQPALAPSDERFLIIRTMITRCAPGLRTSSPTRGWHRLISTAEGIILVRTPQGVWSCPPSSAVWVPAGIRADLEVCGHVSLQMLYIRQSKAAWSAGGTPSTCSPIAVSPLLRELIARIATLPAIDLRVSGHPSVAQLVVHEVRAGSRAPHELVWPSDPRVARIAALVQSNPADPRLLSDLCKGQGASARTIQRLFPLQTGLTFEAWRSRLRFLHASRLLADGTKVSDVATSCGYNSPSAFVSAFKRFAGVTPGEYCRSTPPPA